MSHRISDASPIISTQRARARARALVIWSEIRVINMNGSSVIRERFEISNRSASPKRGR